MRTWIDKFEVMLADAHNTLQGSGSAPRWLREAVAHTASWQTGPSIDQILDDLVRLGQNRPTVQDTTGNVLDMPEDTIVQFFPGADLPHIPVDGLVKIDGLTDPPQLRVVFEGSVHYYFNRWPSPPPHPRQVPPPMALNPRMAPKERALHYTASGCAQLPPIAASHLEL